MARGERLPLAANYSVAVLLAVVAQLARAAVALPHNANIATNTVVNARACRALWALEALMEGRGLGCSIAPYHAHQITTCSCPPSSL